MIEIILLFAIIIGVIWERLTKTKNNLPGPQSFPLIGNFLNFDFQNPQNSWKILSQRYGDMVGLRLFSIKVLLVSGYDAIRETLMNDEVSGRPSVNILKDLDDDGNRHGLVFTDGEEWKTQKRFALHHFRNLGFGKKSHEGVIVEEIENLIEELEELKGAPTSLTQKKLALSAINIVWCIIGGKRFKRSDPKLHELTAAIDEMMHVFSILQFTTPRCQNTNGNFGPHVKEIVGGPVIVMPFLKHIFPTQSGYTSLIKCKNVIAKFINEAIQDHNNQNADEYNDFIGIYLNKIENSSDPSFSIPQLIGVCRDLLCAGTDTSSQTTSFAINFLCLHQDMQNKMYQQIQNVVGKDRLPSVEDRSQLTYVCAFINEVFRFRTISPTFIPHRTLSDVKIQGYTVTKDTYVLMNFESILMDKVYWGDPENFRPERFISEDGKLMKEERLINFGKGKRVCAGENLGKSSVFMILASLIQNFWIHFPEGETLKNTEGLPGFTFSAPVARIVFTPRNPEAL